MTKANIKDIISEHEKEIAEMKRELEKPYPESVKKSIEKEIGFLEDNCYRYKLQAKAWGV